MATANDGVSRFSDSTVYSETTFKQPITVPSIVYDGTAVAGQVGYTYNVAYAPATAAFTTNVMKTIATQLVPAGTYAVAASCATQTTGAVIQNGIGVLSFVDGTGTTQNLAFLQGGNSSNTIPDTSINSFSLSALAVFDAPRTITFAGEFDFSGGAIVTIPNQFTFKITKLF
jgi:hypothetical protein